MNMILKHRVAVSIIYGMLLIAGCSKDDETVPLDISFQGVTLQSSDGGLTYTGKVPSSGLDFIIMSSEPLLKIKVDGVVYIEDDGRPQLSGYWGNIFISISGAIFATNIHLCENTSERNRTITLKYGKANDRCIINLVQPQ